MSDVVVFDNVSIVFGGQPEAALELADAGKDRAEIAEATDQILGVHDCSIGVPEGGILVLMGLSGSGKSTLLRAVNGLNRPCRGEVRVWDGNDTISVTNAGAKQLRRLRQERITMVFQQFGLLPWRTVRENVGLGPELAGLSRHERTSRVDRQLELVGLADRADAKVAELSGGMQQRVGLARAFATEAPILLMDEPFSALDPLIRTRLQDELMELQQALRRSIVFVSHDLDEAFKLGDRIAIMEGGRIVQQGTPRQIFTSPANDYVADFVANMNPLGVLTARDVMQHSDVAVAGDVTPETPLSEVMEELDRGALAVVEDGRRLGAITAEGVLARLAAQHDPKHPDGDRASPRARR